MEWFGIHNTAIYTHCGAEGCKRNHNQCGWAFWWRCTGELHLQPDIPITTAHTRYSHTILWMANGRCIFSDGHWCGNVTLGGQTIKSCFEIFPSGGGWSLLFGKSLLKQFKAIHNYRNDTLKIPSNGTWTTLLNKCEEIPIVRSVKDGNINTNINENPTNTVSEVPTRSTDKGRHGCTFNIFRPNWFNYVHCQKLIYCVTEVCWTCVSCLWWGIFFGNTASGRMWMWCSAPITLVQKTHTSAGLSFNELCHRVNEECIQHGVLTWRLCNGLQSNPITEVAHLPELQSTEQSHASVPNATGGYSYQTMLVEWTPMGAWLWFRIVVLCYFNIYRKSPRPSLLHQR